ncbi:Proton-dependent oligopeptide transporter family [Corchorus capsularis]|uniref:Proton-dependent oligopeptide transporter family n=1 Tax=Corchorus capsularis TaxID=210143 RepID=A0A1R3GPT5_COCAP|nr:Proton-dependent oligopeptide transporter family [Corchorus capsularis]
MGAKKTDTHFSNTPFMANEMSNIEYGEFENWRGEKAEPAKHGGVRASSIVCVVEVLENMVFLSNATNFVAYFLKSIHYPAAQSANMVTNFMGTSFLLTIFGGFISDSFLTRFKTFIIFCTLELLGLILLTIQAQDHRLQPGPNSKPSKPQEATLYTGLYAIAAGVAGVKAALPAHGADQLDHGNQRLISAFFNWFFFSLCFGGLIASTVMIWIEENLGWNWSFKISVVTLSVALCIFAMGFPIYRFKRPGGSPLSRIYKVFASAIQNRKVSLSEAENRLGISGEMRNHEKLRFLNNALISDSITATEIEETKTFLGLLPIFASTIMMNCCLAQLMTFSVQQGNIMNRSLNKFKIPTQSLSVFPLIIMLASIPLYEYFVGLFGIKSNSGGKLNMFQPLRRIGLGLALASGSMAAAAIVESKRRAAANDDNVIISVFWLGWQYLLLGISDMLTLGGMLEFFYSEAPDSMRSMSTALSWCSTSMGYFISSVLVTISNSVSGHFGKEWLGGNDLNHARLDLFYTLLCILNFINLLNYIFWAKRY